VIGGYRPGSNGIDALLVGYYDETACGSQARYALASFTSQEIVLITEAFPNASTSGVVRA
jgi:hypothetical protein